MAPKKDKTAVLKGSEAEQAILTYLVSFVETLSRSSMNVSFSQNQVNR
jgi:hypothetical protein